MNPKITDTPVTDVLIIGGGIAGLKAAIEARKQGADVTVVSETPPGFGNNSAVSRAAFAAVGISEKPDDSVEAHVKDTLESGRFLNDVKLVRTLVENAARQVHDLVGYGVPFKRRSDGSLLVGLAAGHSYYRHVFSKDFKGINITRPLRKYAEKSGVRFAEGMLVTKLLTADKTAAGALAIDKDGNIIQFSARSVVLAAGGAGDIYLMTSNAIGCTGDGYALAYEAGLTLRDMEFVQFHPTTTGRGGQGLIMYERYLPKGATLRNALGEDILKRHGMLEVNKVTRDVLSKTLAIEVMEGRGIDGNVILDFTTIPENEASRMVQRGLMDGKHYHSSISVSPTAHYFMGGVKIDTEAATEIRGLFAAGEVCGGIHAANRLGGNAITETLVFGTIAGEQAAINALKQPQKLAPKAHISSEVERLSRIASGSQAATWEIYRAVQNLMWDKAGIVRKGKRLNEALAEILSLRKESETLTGSAEQLIDIIKVNNMLTVAETVCRAALTRTESRGSHYRTDYPEENDKKWMKVVEVWRRGEVMELRRVPVKIPL
ncbi:MAG: FAD-dependent oxidoreductase [Deltaproteobacteria bacterium]|nr:FAD-dependent oxidoreductase [Deltaproteobacteria bacterium]